MVLPLKRITSSKYLGSVFISDATFDIEISHRIASASVAWHSLKTHIWSCKNLTLARKVLILLKSVVCAALWLWNLACFEGSCEPFRGLSDELPNLCGFTWRGRRSNDSIRALCKLPSLVQVITHRTLRWLGHTARMAQDRLPFQCIFGQSPGTRARGKPANSWQTTVYKDLISLHAQFKWFRIAQDQTG